MNVALDKLGFGVVHHGDAVGKRRLVYGDGVVGIPLGHSSSPLAFGVGENLGGEAATTRDGDEHTIDADSLVLDVSAHLVWQLGVDDIGVSRGCQRENSEGEHERTDCGGESPNRSSCRGREIHRTSWSWSYLLCAGARHRLRRYRPIIA